MFLGSLNRDFEGPTMAEEEGCLAGQLEIPGLAGGEGEAVRLGEQREREEEEESGRFRVHIRSIRHV
jgi:hypothetical protein